MEAAMMHGHSPFSFFSTLTIANGNPFPEAWEIVKKSASDFGDSLRTSFVNGLETIKNSFYYAGVDICKFSYSLFKSDAGLAETKENFQYSFNDGLLSVKQSSSVTDDEDSAVISSVTEDEDSAVATPTKPMQPTVDMERKCAIFKKTNLLEILDKAPDTSNKQKLEKYLTSYVKGEELDLCDWSFVSVMFDQILVDCKTQEKEKLKLQEAQYQKFFREKGGYYNQYHYDFTKSPAENQAILYLISMSELEELCDSSASHFRIGELQQLRIESDKTDQLENECRQMSFLEKDIMHLKQAGKVAFKHLVRETLIDYTAHKDDERWNLGFVKDEVTNTSGGVNTGLPELKIYWGDSKLELSAGPKVGVDLNYTSGKKEIVDDEGYLGVRTYKGGNVTLFAQIKFLLGIGVGVSVEGEGKLIMGDYVEWKNARECATQQFEELIPELRNDPQIAHYLSRYSVLDSSKVSTWDKFLFDVLSGGEEISGIEASKKQYDLTKTHMDEYLSTLVGHKIESASPEISKNGAFQAKIVRHTEAITGTAMAELTAAVDAGLSINGLNEDLTIMHEKFSPICELLNSKIKPEEQKEDVRREVLTQAQAFKDKLIDGWKKNLEVAKYNKAKTKRWDGDINNLPHKVRTKQDDYLTTEVCSDLLQNDYNFCVNLYARFTTGDSIVKEDLATLDKVMERYNATNIRQLLHNMVMFNAYLLTLAKYGSNYQIVQGPQYQKLSSDASDITKLQSKMEAFEKCLFSTNIPVNDSDWEKNVKAKCPIDYKEFETKYVIKDADWEKCAKVKSPIDYEVLEKKFEIKGKAEFVKVIGASVSAEVLFRTRNHPHPDRRGDYIEISFKGGFDINVLGGVVALLQKEKLGDLALKVKSFAEYAHLTGSWGTEGIYQIRYYKADEAAAVPQHIEVSKQLLSEEESYQRLFTRWEQIKKTKTGLKVDIPVKPGVNISVGRTSEAAMTCVESDSFTTETVKYFGLLYAHEIAVGLTKVNKNTGRVERSPKWKKLEDEQLHELMELSVKAGVGYKLMLKKKKLADEIRNKIKDHREINVFLHKHQSGDYEKKLQDVMKEFLSNSRPLPLSRQVGLAQTMKEGIEYFLSNGKLDEDEAVQFQTMMDGFLIITKQFSESGTIAHQIELKDYNLQHNGLLTIDEKSKFQEVKENFFEVSKRFASLHRWKKEEVRLEKKLRAMSDSTIAEKAEIKQQLVKARKKIVELEMFIKLPAYLYRLEQKKAQLQANLVEMSDSLKTQEAAVKQRLDKVGKGITELSDANFLFPTVLVSLQKQKAQLKASLQSGSDSLSIDKSQITSNLQDVKNKIEKYEMLSAPLNRLKQEKLQLQAELRQLSASFKKNKAAIETQIDFVEKKIDQFSNLLKPLNKLKREEVKFKVKLREVSNAPDIKQEKGTIEKKLNNAGKDIVELIGHIESEMLFSHSTFDKPSEVCLEAFSDLLFAYFPHLTERKVNSDLYQESEMYRIDGGWKGIVGNRPDNKKTESNMDKRVVDENTPLQHLELYTGMMESMF